GGTQGQSIDIAHIGSPQVLVDGRPDQGHQDEEENDPQAHHRSQVPAQPAHGVLKGRTGAGRLLILGRHGQTGGPVERNHLGFQAGREHGPGSSRLLRVFARIHKAGSYSILMRGSTAVYSRSESRLPSTTATASSTVVAWITG